MRDDDPWNCDHGAIVWHTDGCANSNPLVLMVAAANCGCAKMSYNSFEFRRWVSHGILRDTRNLINTKYDWHNWLLKNLIMQYSDLHITWDGNSTLHPPGSVQRTAQSFFGAADPSRSTLVRPSSIFMRREFNLGEARGGHNISRFTNHRIPEIRPLGRIVLRNLCLRVMLCDSNSNSLKAMQNVILVPI